MAEKMSSDIIDDLFQSAKLLKSIFIRISKDKEDNVNLLNSRYAAMGVLMRNGAMTMSELGSSLCISKSNLTPIVDSLIDENLISRKYDENDRRLVIVGLTEKGKEVIKKGKEAIKKDFVNLLDGLSREDKEKLFQSARNIKEIISNMTLGDRKQ